VEKQNVSLLFLWFGVYGFVFELFKFLDPLIMLKTDLDPVDFFGIEVVFIWAVDVRFLGVIGPELTWILGIWTKIQIIYGSSCLESISVTVNSWRKDIW
jgi:hypothetical protein